MIKIGSEYIWLRWIAIKPENKEILTQSIPMERNMFVAEWFPDNLIKIHENYPIVSTDDGGTWYHLQACKFLKLDHHIHSTLEKSIIERTIQYIKGRTESFGDYFRCKKEEHCNLFHVKNWMNPFVDMPNKELIDA